MNLSISDFWQPSGQKKTSCRDRGFWMSVIASRSLTLASATRLRTCLADVSWFGRRLTSPACFSLKPLQLTQHSSHAVQLSNSSSFTLWWLAYSLSLLFVLAVCNHFFFILYFTKLYLLCLCVLELFSQFLDLLSLSTSFTIITGLLNESTQILDQWVFGNFQIEHQKGTSNGCGGGTTFADSLRVSLWPA